MSIANKSSGRDSQQKELPGIQHLRGIAAVLVVFAHIDGMFRFPKYFNDNTLFGWLDSGAVGVHLFFVISGFIIPYVSLNTHSLAPKTTYSSFLQNRFARIIPFMWACILGYALLRFVGRGSLPGVTYLRALTLFPVGEVEPNVIWTLRHEFLFYGIFCLTILYSSKQRWAAMAAWFLSPVLWFILITNIPTLSGDAFVNELCNFLFNKFNLLFGVGFVIGVLHMKGYLVATWNTRHGFLLCFLSTIPLLVAAHIFVLDADRNSFWEFIVFGLTAAFSVIIGIFLRNTQPSSIVDRIGLKLGDASYSIYLTHTAIVSALLGVWSKLQPSAHFVLVLTGGTVIVCLGGIFVHQFVEKPIIRAAKKMLSHKRSSSPEVNKST
jgi:exopolysaccharide production protein ExoZ